jgi:hypothetical protein
MNTLHALLRITLGSVFFGALASSALGQPLPVLLKDDFEHGMQRWQTTDPDLETSVWKIERIGAGEAVNHVLRVTGPSSYQPPFRSPHSIAWLKDVDVGSFQIDVRVQNTRPDAGPHRDLCVFWGRQDAGHFYYVHLGAQPDPHACQVFIVNGAARRAITTVEARGIPWSDDWHKVRVSFDAESGEIKVYFDDLDTPIMQAKDKTFTHGQVGLGTFDDHGNFDDFVLRAVRSSASK